MNGKSVMIGYNRRDPKSVRIAEEICAELTVSGFAPLSLKYDDGGTGGLKGAKSSESGEVTLRVSSDPTPITAEVVSITDSGRGDGTAVYVFECDTLTASVASGRTAQFKYIVNSYGGLRISKSALRYTDDDVRGVFIVQGGKLVFRKVNVEYWGEDYIICTQEADDGYLKLYDKIVTEGKDLYEGKVVE